MGILRFVVALIAMGGLCFGLAREVAIALRTGRVRYGRAQGERFAKRKTQPVLFWLIIFVFALFSMTSAGVFVWVVQETLTGAIVAIKPIAGISEGDSQRPLSGAVYQAL